MNGVHASDDLLLSNLYIADGPDRDMEPKNGATV
jgi:hypothetical protein